MPNHVKNLVEMQGIANEPLFIERGGEKEFDFNKLIQMPEDLDVVSGSVEDDAFTAIMIELEKWFNNHRFMSKFSLDECDLRKERYMSLDADDKKELLLWGVKYLSNIVNYGHTSWYGWCRENWGTKWNAYETYIMDDDLISFETAWACPLPVLKALSQKYPDRVIHVWYADEAAGSNADSLVFYNGEQVDSLNPTDEQELLKLYVKCWGEDEWIYTGDDGRIHMKED